MDAASYLFFNAYEMNCDDLSHLKWEFDIFEDVFLCVCPNEVILYCNFASFSLIMPYVSHWPNLRIHFVNENLTNDPEKHEDLKISIFENTMSNLKKVCIPYTDAHGNKVNKFNKLMIENWPLIQSYAYDAKHQFSREFFTLSREVIDVGDDFYQLRQRIDPVFIERFLSKTIISFASSFELTLRSIDSSYQCTQSKELIDRQIKALTSMYKYSKSKSDNSEKNIYPPFLLYGSKTNKKYLKSPSTLSFLADESDNIHLIIHGSDQSTGISCERTYFIQKSIKSDSKQKKSLKALIQIYLHLLSAVAMLINQIKTTLLGFNEIISMTKEEIEKKIGFIKYDEIDIGLEYVLGEPNETVRLLTVMIRVYDVQVEDGETIGSIAFKDTLLISALQLNDILISRNVINLTENIPCMCYWTPVSQILEHIDKETSEKEKCLLNGELEITSIPAGNVCLSSIKCNFYEDHIVLHGKRYGVTVLEPKRIYHYRSPDAFHPDFIELQVDSNFSEKTNKLISPYIYSTLLEETNEDGSHTSIWFIVKQRSKIRRLLIEHVFPTWRSRGLLELSSKEPNKYAVKASFSSYDLEQNFLKSAAHDDLIPEEILKRKIEPSDKECNLSITEILACQPSIKTWIQMYRDELSHAEASLCYVVPIPTANTCVDLCLKCGINPQSYIDMEAGEKVDWNYIFKKAVVWINHVHNNFKVITSSFEDEASNTHPGISKMDLKEINSCTESKFSYAELSSLLTTIKKPLIVTIICGPPGSQKELVVTNILNYANEGIEWIVMTPDNADEISTSLYKGLMKYCETQCNIDTNREIKSRCHGILLCPGITGPREVLASLAEFHREHGLKENITPIKIGCAATCVDLRMAIMDNGKMTFPGVLELIAEGWTNYLLLTGPSKSNLLNSTKMGVPFTEIEELLHSANPRLSHLFIPDGKIENSRTLEALMDENAFSNPILQRSRLLSYPSLCTLTPPTPRLHNITLHFNQPLDRKLFVNALNGIFENLKPWPFHGNIYTLNGEIAFLEVHNKFKKI
ncbi:hypothetical protein EWB00_006168 [Schistosoma japonicum]|uniref:Uncharacterized protein n=1 Tax=Schistosoma japonicum TaxID=6182 RepID=A0A4Z2CZI1_SCHJA|nr:hypothetical protein EWB00_006168 [Schistosoma japonicum]